MPESGGLPSLSPSSDLAIVSFALTVPPLVSAFAEIAGAGPVDVVNASHQLSLATLSVLLVMFALREFARIVHSPAPAPAPIETRDAQGDAGAVGKYRRSGLKPEQIALFAERLEKHMMTNEPYLDSGLKIESLARQINVSRNYLTQVLNEGLGKNYYQYVNGYRVETAKRLLMSEDARSLSILEIAYECGFNSKATFNLAFKRLTGVTPSEYRCREEKAAESISDGD